MKSTILRNGVYGSVISFISFFAIFFIFHYLQENLLDLGGDYEKFRFYGILLTPLVTYGAIYFRQRKNTRFLRILCSIIILEIVAFLSCFTMILGNLSVFLIPLIIGFATSMVYYFFGISVNVSETNSGKI